MDLLSNIVKDFKLTHADLPRIEKQLFFDGPDSRKSLERFGLLMFFATFIATFGVIADSTATVIGAMLIAPLMTPILATAAAVVTGQMERAGRSLLIVVAGAGGAIGLAWLLGVLYHSGVILVHSNSQIVSRVSPSLVDLYAALGAGAVGAIATSREDIADTLPGAAIAIALVPPLAVVGLTLSQGAWDEALGATLLFLTNFFAILLAGSAVLALLGLSAAATGKLHGNARRRAILVIIVGTLLVALPLSATSYNALRAATAQSRVTKAAQAWVKGTAYEVVSTAVKPDGVTIEIAGSGEPPEVGELIAAAQTSTDQQVTIRVKVIPTTSEEFTVWPAQAVD